MISVVNKSLISRPVAIFRVELKDGHIHTGGGAVVIVRYGKSYTDLFDYGRTNR